MRWINFVPTGHEVGTATTVSGEILASFFMSFYISKNNFKKFLKSCPVLSFPIQSIWKAKWKSSDFLKSQTQRGSDSSSDCTLTIEGADTSWGTCLLERIRLVQAMTPKGKSEAIMTPPKGIGPLLKQRLWLFFCSRVIWNDNDQMYMYRQSPNANT